MKGRDEGRLTELSEANFEILKKFKNSFSEIGANKKKICLARRTTAHVPSNPKLSQIGLATTIHNTDLFIICRFISGADRETGVY